ncbi:protein kinase, partial [Planctomycetota bacterium]
MLLEIGRDGESHGCKVEWDGRKPLVIGRSRETDFPVKDPLLSRRQCLLDLAEGEIALVDLDSANGTFVNGKRIGRATIRSGDLVTFGRSWLRVVNEPAGARGAGEDDPDATADVSPFPPSRGGRLSARVRATAVGDDDPFAVPRIIEGYEVTATLGRGSFGTVYKAQHRMLGREVAIKVLPTGEPQENPDAVERFLREIRATGQLDHPNLVRVYGAGEGPGYAYLVMELVQGETLARHLRAVDSLAPCHALRVARQVVSALDHAFSHGYVHRDVKPENILIAKGGTAKLCDFGLVKSLGASASDGLTRPGQGFGSVAYMPPEQVRSAKSADQRADIYSIGATLYTMLTGRRPFTGKVTRSLLRRVLEEMPTPVRQLNPAIPTQVSDLVERCMQKDPDDRFQSPSEMLGAIDRASEILDGHACGPGPEETPVPAGPPAPDAEGSAPEVEASTPATGAWTVPPPEAEGAVPEVEASTPATGAWTVPPPEPVAASPGSSPSAAGPPGGAGAPWTVSVSPVPGPASVSTPWPSAPQAAPSPPPTIGWGAQEVATDRDGSASQLPAGTAAAPSSGWSAPDAPAAAGAFPPPPRGGFAPGVGSDREPGADIGGEAASHGTLLSERPPTFEPAVESAASVGPAAAGGEEARPPAGKTVVGVPAFEDGPGARPPAGKTVVGVPSFDQGEEARPPAGKTVVGVPAFEGGPGARPPAGQTVVGVPSFDDGAEAGSPVPGKTVVGAPSFDDGSGARPPAGRTVVGVPSFDDRSEARSPAGRTVVGVPSFDDGSKARPPAGRTVAGVPSFDDGAQGLPPGFAGAGGAGGSAVASTLALTPDQVAQAKAEALARAGGAPGPGVPGPRSPVPQPLPGPSARPPEPAFDLGAATMATARPQLGPPPVGAPPATGAGPPTGMASTVALTPDQVAQAKAEALAAMGASGPPNVPGPRSPVPQPLPGPSARPPEPAFDPGAATMATPRPQLGPPPVG